MTTEKEKVHYINFDLVHFFDVIWYFIAMGSCKFYSYAVESILLRNEYWLQTVLEDVGSMSIKNIF